ncbi:MAG TPA: DUF4292 domain-containing protein [Bacteroidales bacterium]|nr:DUF4292 domain-containing protein [Bacteroidales bacterium]HOH84354.1 DUF4292 domain-containing protein [Bacteroidales bacterium]
MNNRVPFLVICCVAMLLLFSCRTKQAVLELKPGKTVDGDSSAAMKIQPFLFHTLSLKFDAEVQSGDENNNFSGNIYVVRDSALWVSVQKFGLEVVRVLITNDSVRMLDRINKSYLAGDFSLISGILKTSIDFDGLQSLITGNDVMSYEDAGYTEKNTGDTLVYYFAKRKKKTGTSSISQEIMVNKVDNKICKNTINNLSQNSGWASFSYSDFESFDGQKYPGKIAFQVSNTGTLEGIIEFTRITPEKKESLPFNVPDTYVRKN